MGILLSFFSNVNDVVLIGVMATENFSFILEEYIL